MTPNERAVHALNLRLERLQANLREAKAEATQQVLFQSLVLTLGMSEGMNDYIHTVGQFAQRRRNEFKDRSSTDVARHNERMNFGNTLLEQLKQNPTDRTLRLEIGQVHRDMVALQKDMRRDAFSLQRELTASAAMIDKVAEIVRRFCAAEDRDTLKRQLAQLVRHVRELYAALKTTLPARNIIDADAWEKSALAGLEQAEHFHDAYARAGSQALVAFELMTMAVSENPPRSTDDAIRRANEAVAARLAAITARFTASSP